MYICVFMYAHYCTFMFMFVQSFLFDPFFDWKQREDAAFGTQPVGWNQRL